MIHHVSLAVKDPRHVANVFAKIFGGSVANLANIEDQYIAWAGDEVGTCIEFYKQGAELHPDPNDGPANIRHNPSASPYTITHIALSVSWTEEQVMALAKEEGWRAARMHRGGSEVIELWVENQIMIELLTPELTQDYLKFTGWFRR